MRRRDTNQLSLKSKIRVKETLVKEREETSVVDTEVVVDVVVEVTAKAHVKMKMDLLKKQDRNPSPPSEEAVVVVVSEVTIAEVEAIETPEAVVAKEEKENPSNKNQLKNKNFEAEEKNNNTLFILKPKVNNLKNQCVLS